MKSNPTCLFIENIIKGTDIIKFLGTDYYIVVKKNLDTAYNVLNFKPIICTIIDLNGSKIPTIQIEKYTRNYKNIPLIAILEDHDIELARYCGELGINRVLLTSEINTLSKIIKETSFERNTQITLKTFGLDINNYKESEIVFESLKIIENNYTLLMNVQEIAYRLGISENSLPREFSKFKLVSPKKFILYFKVSHALQLMENKGLRLNEIASLSGFSNVRRFNECFHRIFEKSPCSIRETVKKCGFVNVWKTRVDKKSEKQNI